MFALVSLAVKDDLLRSGARSVSSLACRRTTRLFCCVSVMDGAPDQRDVDVGIRDSDRLLMAGKQPAVANA